MCFENGRQQLLRPELRGKKEKKKKIIQRDGEIGDVEEDKNEKMCDEKIQSELGYFVII